MPSRQIDPSTIGGITVIKEELLEQTEYVTISEACEDSIKVFSFILFHAMIVQFGINFFLVASGGGGEHLVGLEHPIASYRVVVYCKTFWDCIHIAIILAMHVNGGAIWVNKLYKLMKRFIQISELFFKLTIANFLK